MKIYESIRGIEIHLPSWFLFNFFVINVSIFIFGGWLGVGSNPCHPNGEVVRQQFLLIRSSVPPAERSSHRWCPTETVILRNFAKFTGKFSTVPHFFIFIFSPYHSLRPETRLQTLLKKGL